MVYDNSRYLQSTILKRIGFNLPTFRLRFRNVFNEENCAIYEWCEGDTLDGIAYRFYGFTALRWAILDANPIYRTEFDIKNGDYIFIPDFEEVVRLVNV